MQQKDFDSYIKHSIDNLEIDPPEHLWDNIENKLDHSKRNRKIAYISFTGLAASILLLFTLNNILPKKEYTPTRTFIAQNYTIKSKNEIATVYTEKPITRHISINREKRQYISPVEPKKSIACSINSKPEDTKKIDNLDERNIIKANIAQAKTKKSIEIGINSITGNSSNYESAPDIMRSSFTSPHVLNNNVGIPKYKSKLHTNLNIRISYPISKRLSIVSGLGYLGFSSTFEDKYYYGDVSEFYNINMPEISDKSIKDIDQDFAYLELPVLLKYSIIDRRISMYMSAGVGLDYLISNSSKIYFNDNTSEKTSSKSLKDLTSCGLISIGVSTPIYKAFSINIEGQYRYFFNSISKNKVLETKQSMPGLSFGLSYNF